MLENFLSKLGATTKITVGVSVSPGVGLEMIETDKLTGTVNKYAHEPLDYNHSTREISEYAQFQSSLEELFDDLHIARRSNIILSIPNVHFGMISLPLLLTDEAITNAIISEVEQSYIFKRQEPVVSWCEVFSNVESENRVIAYTAIQKNALNEISNACEEIGCTLVGIENSYASLLRALYFSGIAKNQMKDNVSWNLMIVGQNSYSILSMSGKKVIEYYEEPLALKSFVDDEIYNAITTSAQLTLVSLPANYLFIVSETDLVSAEVLSMKMPVECTTNFLECNKFCQSELLPANLNILPNLALQMTPEAIGVSVYNSCDFPLKLNMATEKEGEGSFSEELTYPRVNIGNLEVEITPDFVKKLSLLIGAIIILPIIMLSFLLSNVVTPREQTKLDGINAEITSVNAEIDKLSGSEKNTTFDLNSTINDIITRNTTKLAYYSGLGVSIPKKLWISYYNTNEAGKVDIKGKANDVESIYAFYKGLKQMVNNSDIRLYKLEFASESIDDVISDNSSSPKVYEFEITNMTESEINPEAAKAESKDAAKTDEAAPAEGEKKSFFQLGKPIFGTSSTDTKTDTSTTSTTTTTAPTTTSTPTQPASGSPDQLPKNLEKIEKF